MNMSDIVPWPLKDVSKSIGDSGVRLMIKSGIARKISSDNLLYMPMGTMVIDKLVNLILQGYGKAYSVIYDYIDQKGIRSFYKILNEELNGKRAVFYSKTNTKLEVYFQENKFIGPYLPDFLEDYIKKVNDIPIYVTKSESGTRKFLLCQECGKIYQPDILEIKSQVGAPQPLSDIMEVYTPGAVTIDKLCKSLDISPSMTVKTMIYEVEKQNKKDYYAIMVRGDRSISAEKLRRYFGADRIGLADESVVESITGSPPGFCGPVGINIPIFADMEISCMDELVAGANKKDTHLVGCTPGRDFQVEAYLDLRCGSEGDNCPNCNAALRTVKGDIAIEGYRSPEGIYKWIYSMGEFLKIIVKNGMSETGIKWPEGLSPFDAVIEVTSIKNELLCHIAEDIIKKLSDRYNILYDDRDAGLKARLMDMDLIGIPYTIIISGSSLENGICEIKTNSGMSKEIKIDMIGEFLDET